MTGAELIKWIQENQAEDMEIMVVGFDEEYGLLREESINITGDYVYLER